MKLFCFLLIALLISCSPHVDDPEVTLLLTPHDTVFFNTQNGKIYDGDSAEISVYQLTATVSDVDTYTVDVGGVPFDTMLDTGTYVFDFPWSSVALSSVIQSSVGNSYSNLSVSTVIDTFDTENFAITKFNSTYDSLIVNPILGTVFTPDLVELDSFSVDITVKEAGEYEVTVGSVVQTLHFPVGTYQLKYGWDELTLEETLLCSAKLKNSTVQTVTDEVEIIELKLFNDPYLRYAWHLQVSEKSFAEQWDIDPESHISVEKVWKTVRGRGVKVAIIDNDFEENHEDLAANVVDVYNAVTDNKVLVPGHGASHGTTVAGAVAAVADNRIGISGVAPNSELILIQLENAKATDARTIRAFNYAREQGAKVINCSWGSYNVSDAVSAIVKEMYDDGITVVFATGNSGYSLEYMNDESELPWVIGVGVSTEQNDYWRSSDYSDSLEVIAPGAGSPGFLGLDNMGVSGSGNQADVVDINYGYVNGASFSAPTVAGVVALMLEANPLLTPKEIRTILVETADKVGGDDATYVNGFDSRRFHGKVNASAAVERAML